jgi:Fanconi anemia group M protein
MTNTLVSLPTGLGKTLIAAVVMYNYYRWFPTGKIVFCAPTRPLVTQQIKACYNITGIPERHTAEISGKSKAEARQRMWEAKRVFFCTPQTIVKDIECGRCNAREIVCVVMDEAHKATGDHASAQLVDLIKDSGAKFRLVGLSATPGTDIKSIQKVITKLDVCQIEAKTEDDPDVKQYIHNRAEEVVIVKQPDAISRIDKKFADFMRPLIERLQHTEARGMIQNTSSLNQYTVLKAKEAYLRRSGDHSLDGHFAAVSKFATIRNKLHTHGILTVRAELQTLDRYAKPGFVGNLVKKNEFQVLLHAVSNATHATQDDDDLETKEDLMKNNPKYEKLYEILLGEYCIIHIEFHRMNSTHHTYNREFSTKAGIRSRYQSNHIFSV